MRSLELFGTCSKEATCNPVVHLPIIETLNGCVVQQVVFHLHVHVVPRYSGDDVAAQVAARKPLSHDESVEMAEKIKAALSEDDESSLPENKL